ncbi:hypothetical protein D3C72_1350530 [compost metagenome]
MQLGDGVEAAIVPVAVLVHAAGGAEGEAGVLLGLGAGLVLAGEQAAGQRVVGNHAQALFGRERQQLALDLAEQQAVARLHRHEAREPVQLGLAQRARQAVGQEVRHADVARAARLDDDVERLQAFFERGLAVVHVQLVQVDVVGLQALEREVDGVEQVLARGALVPGVGADLVDGLGGDHEAAAARGALLVEPVADDLFGAAGGLDGAAQRVHVGGVKEVDAGVGGLVQDLVRHGLVGLQAEGHGAQGQAGHGEAGTAQAGGGDAHAGSLREGERGRERGGGHHRHGRAFLQALEIQVDSRCTPGAPRSTEKRAMAATAESAFFSSSTARNSTAQPRASSVMRP